jgi:hypothetical protein
LKSNKIDDMANGKLKDKLKSFFVRCGQETPPFFKKLRMAGIIIAAAGTAVVSAPVALPALLVTIGGYLIAGGAVASAVSQAAIEESEDCEDDDFQPLAN